MIGSEARIVWLEDPELHEYVREAHVVSRRRRGRPYVGLPGRLVGYAELRRSTRAEEACFVRRIFWLKPYDRGEPEDDGTYASDMPCEAVDPKAVGPRLDRRTGAWT